MNKDLHSSSFILMDSIEQQYENLKKDIESGKVKIYTRSNAIFLYEKDSHCVSLYSYETFFTYLRRCVEKSRRLMDINNLCWKLWMEFKKKEYPKLDVIDLIKSKPETDPLDELYRLPGGFSKVLPYLSLEEKLWIGDNVDGNILTHVANPPERMLENWLNKASPKRLTEIGSVRSYLSLIPGQVTLETFYKVNNKAFLSCLTNEDYWKVYLGGSTTHHRLPNFRMRKLHESSEDVVRKLLERNRELTMYIKSLYWKDVFDVGDALIPLSLMTLDEEFLYQLKPEHVNKLYSMLGDDLNLNSFKLREEGIDPEIWEKYTKTSTYLKSINSPEYKQKFGEMVLFYHEHQPNHLPKNGYPTYPSLELFSYLKENFKVIEK